MNNLHLSEEAQRDLLEIKAYIEDELLNTSAALATESRWTACRNTGGFFMSFSSSTLYIASIFKAYHKAQTSLIN